MKQCDIMNAIKEAGWTKDFIDNRRNESMAKYEGLIKYT